MSPAGKPVSDAIDGRSRPFDRNPGLGAVVDTFRGRWLPFREMLDQSESVTLYEAIRETLGANPDLGLCAWENHNELRAWVNAAHGRLNEALRTQLEVRGTAEGWSMNRDRSELEMTELFATADGLEGLPQVGPVPRPQQRVEIRGLTGVGKYRGAIISVLAERVELDQATWPKALADLVANPLTDRKMLAHVEDLRGRARAESIAETTVPVELSKSAGEWLGSHGNSMYSWANALDQGFLRPGTPFLKSVKELTESLSSKAGVT